MGGLTRLSLVFLEDLLVDIGSVGLFSSVDKARLSFGAENWSSDLFVCPVSFPCHLGVGRNPDEYRCNGGHDHQQSIQQYPTAPKCQTERVFQFFQHVFILLISIATICNSFHMDAVLWWSFLRSQGGLHHWARMWWHQRREPRDDGFIRFIWDERCGYVILFHVVWLL